MTTPNIEELPAPETLAQMAEACETLTSLMLIIPGIDTGAWAKTLREADASMQSQAERIKELNLQVVSAFGQAQEALEDRDTARAQLAALQVDDELPDEQIERAIAAWFDENIVGFNNRMRAALAAARSHPTPEESSVVAGEKPVREPLTDGPVISGYAIPVSEKRFADEILIQRSRQIEGHPLWAVRLNGNCLNKQGQWEWEPMPSSRDDEFLAWCRFDSAESAIAAAHGITKKGEQ